MNDIMRQDIELRPSLFHRTGPADQEAISRLLASVEMAIPVELVDIWQRWGAILMYETEELLAPGVAFSWSAELSEQNAYLREQGMPARFLVIGSTFGNWLAIDGATGLLSEVSQLHDYAVLETFSSIGDWYVRYERAEFGPKYGLPPIDDSSVGQ